MQAKGKCDGHGFENLTGAGYLSAGNERAPTGAPNAWGIARAAQKKAKAAGHRSAGRT